MEELGDSYLISSIPKLRGTVSAMFSPKRKFYRVLNFVNDLSLIEDLMGLIPAYMVSFDPNHHPLRWANLSHAKA